MKRRLLPILMTLVLVCALPIWAAFVTSGDVTNPLVSTADATSPTLVDVDTPEKLEQAITAGNSVKLTDNIEITETLVVTKSLTLDLNGHVLKMTGEGRSVLYVYNNATLTIQDSSANGAGTITGGNATDGGGVHIGGVGINESEGYLVMTGGTITGCHAGSRGGGVFVFKGSFAMSGTARITNCTADDGGGVLVHTGMSTFTMTGGEISDCIASYGGGVGLIGGAWFEMTGGIIQRCTAVKFPESSAIDVNSRTMKAHGGTVIGNVRVVSSNITHDSEKDYTIFDGTITFVGSSNITALYPVKFELDGGTGLENTTVTLNSPLPQPQPPVRPGYEFTGWTVTVTGTEPQTVVSGFEFGSTPVTAPLTLTAKWEKKPSSGYYYAPPAEEPIEAPKTADPGIALYAALSLLSLTGLTCTAKKR